MILPVRSKAAAEAAAFSVTEPTARLFPENHCRATDSASAGLLP
jgi:hypothetical protein